MLPGLTTLFPPLQVLRRVVAVLLSLVLSFTLSACGGSQPSQKVLLSALSLQIDLTPCLHHEHVIDGVVGCCFS